MFCAARAGIVCGVQSTTTEGSIMTKLIADMSMSLDGKHRDSRTTTSAASSSGSSTVTPRSARSAPRRPAPRLLRDAFESIGALIGGRTYFDLAQGWGGRHPMGVPVYILTHEPPADWPSDSTIHFVTDGLESAVAQAREAAAGKDIGVATPSLVRQCLDAGLLDELQVNVVPVVLGEGRPFFDGIAQAVDLEGPEVVEGSGVTHLRYRIARGAENGTGTAARDAARRITQAGRSA